MLTTMNYLKQDIETNMYNVVNAERLGMEIENLKARTEKEMERLREEQASLYSQIKPVFATVNDKVKWMIRDDVNLTLESGDIIELVGSGVDANGRNYFLINPKIEGCYAYLTISDKLVQPIVDEDEETEELISLLLDDNDVPEASDPRSLEIDEEDQEEKESPASHLFG